jgi:hypothetical protein
MTKKCFKCQRVLSIDNFYVHRQMKDGHLNKCKDCAKKDVSSCYRQNIEDRRAYEKNRNKRQYRKQQFANYHRSYIEKNPLKYKAHNAVSNALRDGRLFRPSNCSVCGIQCKPHAHHEDYNKPLDVIWVCARCHRKITDGQTA